MERVTESKVIGIATPRIDGPAKVCGTAQYSSDHGFPDMLYAWPVGATIANGSVTALETAVAQSMTGVVAIYHRGNIGELHRVPPTQSFGLKVDETRRRSKTTKCATTANTSPLSSRGPSSRLGRQLNG